MTNYDVVKKLIGNITPVADSAIDSQRLENMKAMCELLRQIFEDVDDVACRYRNSLYSSQKEVGQYANKFLSDLTDKDE